MRGRAREPINMLFRSTDTQGVRRLFAGTPTSLALLDDVSGTWTDLITGIGGPQGSYWTAAQLKDFVLFNNDFYPPLLYGIGGLGQNPQSIADLNFLLVEHAKFSVSWGGFAFIANTVEGGQRFSTRIRWSDLDDPTLWRPGVPASSLAGFQDLPYGDEIIGVVPMVSGLYWFTRTSIWVMSAAAAPSTWSFTRVYTEPEESSGCLAFSRTLVSTGSECWYMAPDGIYRWSPYLTEPVREDWMHKACGVIFKDPVRGLDPSAHPWSPVSWYDPATRTITWSWPGKDSLNVPSVGSSVKLNNWSLATRVDQKVSTVIDHGFTAATSLRFNPATGEFETEMANILAASGEDWCVKDLGGPFYREMAPVNVDPTVDMPEQINYEHRGYYSVLRGEFPLGMSDREKAIRMVRIEHDTSIEAVPGIIRLRVGNSFSKQDPNDVDDVCSVLWSDFMDKQMACPEPRKISDLKANGLRTSAPATEWHFLFEGRFCYFEFTIANPDGTARVGSDVCISNIDFQARVKGN